MTVNFNNLRNLGGSGGMPADFLASILNPQPSIQAPAIGSFGGLPTDVPMLNSIGPAPSFMEGIGADISNWFNKTPLATTTNGQGMKTQGMFDMGLGTAQGLLGAYLGFQNLGIGKKTLDNNIRQFDMNFGAAAKTTNARLEDRQNSRVAFGAGATPTVDYMKKNGI
jgi:hypothetical protein